VKNSAWLLLILFTLFMAASCNIRSARPKPVMVYEYAGGGEDVVLENQYLSLRFLPETAEIILTDKNTGVEWRSNPANPSDDRYADPVTRQLMESQFSLDYADSSGVGMTLQSGVYSVERDAYEYEVKDGVLEVRYTVGDIARSFRIPPALPEERMIPFLDRMPGEERRRVEAAYRLYDINNLRQNDDRATLLSNYPDLSRVKLYVLRDNTPEYMREVMERLFSDAGYTYDEYFEDSIKYEVSSESVKPAFSLTVRYILDGRSLVVNVPFDSIGYRSVFSITQFTLLPFMGAGNTTDEGFLFVPDGSGAIINFNNGKQNQIPYSINVYGWDEAMHRVAVISDNKAPFPAFGIQKNGSALLGIIEEGAAYASIRADISGRNCSWNRVYPLFDMIHGARMDISGRNQREVYLYEAALPEGENITVRYTLCQNPGYVGMAHSYREWLLNYYPRLKSNSVTRGVPVAVEVIGAVNKTQHRFGLPFDLPLKLTSYKETESIINDLAGFGWRNVQVKLNGWFNRSVEHTVPTKVNLIGALGSKRDFRRILSAAEKNDFTLYPEADFMFVRDVGTFSGFSLYRDASRYVSRDRVERFPYSFIWFGERKQWGKLNYLARPVVTDTMIRRFMRRAGSFGVENIAFRNMASKLAGDYHERRRVSREASMRMRQQMFSDLRESGSAIAVNAGFQYAVPWANIITDMIINDQSFGITDSAVPFYQIALHGIVPYTGRAINLAEDYTLNLLKTIESGAGLYFSFMTEETAVLQETKFRQFYANQYDRWADDANEIYQKFVSDFGHLYHQRITDHNILAPGVTVTKYEDGTNVVVNTADSDFSYNGRNVAANSYIVQR